MRICKPETNDRQTIDRTSRCWNDDFKFRCHGQLVDFVAPRQVIDAAQEHRRRPSIVGGIDRRRGFASGPVGLTQRATFTGNCLPHGQRLNRSSSFLKVDLAPTDFGRAVDPFETVEVSGMIAPLFVLFRSLVSLSFLAEVRNPAGDPPFAGCQIPGMFVTVTGS